MKPALRRRSLRRWSAGFLVSVLLWAPAAGAEKPAATRVLIPGQAGLMLQYALAEARKRLERPSCAALLNEFHAVDGLPLTAHVSGAAADYLSTLYFVDGDEDRRCTGAHAPIAFTAPGHPVIYVCSSHFARKYLQSQSFAEVVLIHEMLHAAGLGENPPTSDQISRTTMARCAST